MIQFLIFLSMISFTFTVFGFYQPYGLNSNRIPVPAAKSPPRIVFQCAKPFPYLEEDCLQDYLLKDIERRYNELIALSWLGRIYLTVPFLFEAIWPSLFLLEMYSDESLCFSKVTERENTIECTLKESSILSRGIPFKLQLSLVDGKLFQASLLGIGCDLTSLEATGMEPLSRDATKALKKSIQQDRACKKLLVKTIVSTIHQRFAQIPNALKQRVGLETCGTEVEFSPKEELFAQEGTFEKWLEKVSGYYFARSKLQKVRFVPGDVKVQGVSFTFYYDPEEPVNSDDPFRNVNPEVICCNFEE